MRRTRLELWRDILTKARIPSLKTHIVYSCNLNFKTVLGYLSRMIDKKLMKEIRINGTRYYVTTESGISFLEITGKLSPFF